MLPKFRMNMRTVSPSAQGVLKRGQHILKRLRDYAGIHQALLLLTIFILFNNIISVKAQAAVAYFTPENFISDPYQIADTVRLLEQYTPNINENPDDIALSLEANVNGNFISTNPLIATMPGLSDEESPKSTPAPASTPAQRAIETRYTVQIGDTISGIGSKFGLKIASIRLANNISDVDSIKPGQVLNIPAQDASEKALKAAADRQKASQELAQTTTNKKVITSAPQKGYGLIVPIRHNGISRGLVGGHTGIDYRANVGTPIAAAADGVVTIAANSGWNGGYGDTVLISHAGGMTTRYGHMSSVQVRAGQRVTQGQQIGLSGNTGRSTGPHLHFELRVNGAARNPFP